MLASVWSSFLNVNMDDEGMPCEISTRRRRPGISAVQGKGDIAITTDSTHATRLQ